MAMNRFYTKQVKKVTMTIIIFTKLMISHISSSDFQNRMVLVDNHKAEFLVEKMSAENFSGENICWIYQVKRIKV